MGGIASKQTIHSTNDYELVIRSAKELEWILDNHFGATGQGLHQKVSSVTSLPPQLVKQMRYLATIRNRLVHEMDFNQIPDRAAFIQKFEDSAADLKRIMQERGKSSTPSCTIC